MNKQGPIVIIEDDTDDQHLLEEAFKELGYPNEIKFFTNRINVLPYLREEGIYPFLILSDVNMPKLDGFELRKMIQTDETLAAKCIPYLFSTHVSEKAVTDAYMMSVQGFFLKPHDFAHFVSILRKIIEYWQECYSPGRYMGMKQ